MGKISTSEIMDRFFSQASESKKLLKSRVDNPVIYEYEIEIGKEFIDMNEEEIFNLILRYIYSRKRKENDYAISYSAFSSYRSLMNGIFKWYIKEIELVRNPFSTELMKPDNIVARLSDGRERLTWGKVEEIIAKLHVELKEDFADHLELIIWLYYCGFGNAREIALAQLENLNPKNQTVAIMGKKIYLSNRCMELINKFNNMTQIEANGWSYELIRWNGSLLKFKVKPYKVKDFDARPIQQIGSSINRYFCVEINDRFGTNINYHRLYMLGFYDYLVKQKGEKETDRLIHAYNDGEANRELLTLARNYGVIDENIVTLKKGLYPYTANSDCSEKVNEDSENESEEPIE